MFYQRVLTLCEKQGITMTQLVLRLGLSRSNVTNWKNGCIPRIDKIDKIAAFFHVSADYLLGKTENEQLADDLQPGHNFVIMGKGGKGGQHTMQISQSEYQAAMQAIEKLRKKQKNKKMQEE